MERPELCKCFLETSSLQILGETDQRKSKRRSEAFQPPPGKGRAPQGVPGAAPECRYSGGTWKGCGWHILDVATGRGGCGGQHGPSPVPQPAGMPGAPAWQPLQGNWAFQTRPPQTFCPQGSSNTTHPRTRFPRAGGRPSRHSRKPRAATQLPASSGGHLLLPGMLHLLHSPRQNGCPGVCGFAGATHPHTYMRAHSHTHAHMHTGTRLPTFHTARQPLQSMWDPLFLFREESSSPEEQHRGGRASQGPASSPSPLPPSPSPLPRRLLPPKQEHRRWRSPLAEQGL